MIIEVTIGGLILIATVIVLAVGIYYAYLQECREWNGGMCAKSGKPWISFGVDSQGGMMFSDKAGNYCDISYDHIIKDRRNVENT